MSQADKPVNQFRIPQTTAALSNMNYLYDVGCACGQLLRSIPSLVTSHLDESAEFHNKPRPALISTAEFTSAVDAHIRFLRIRHGCSERFPDDIGLDRKGRSRRRTYRKRYISELEACFKNALREALGPWMGEWTEVQTENFNKGVDKSLTGMMWSRYPATNVCLEAGKDCWAVWLRSRCEELGIQESKAGRKVFDENMFPWKLETLEDMTSKSDGYRSGVS